MEGDIGPILEALLPLTYLRGLRMNANHLVGEIPDCAGDLLNLRVLDLGRNKLTFLITII